MKSRVGVLVALLICVLLVSEAVAAGGEVYVLDIKGPIDRGLASYVETASERAVAAGASVIVLRIDTPGGLLDAAERIRDEVLSMPVPTVAFVEGRALSAGALIALACETVAMAPGATLGAAEPIPSSEKVVSAVAGEFRATAEARGRDPEVAAAMVDADLEIEGLVGRGKLLTLTAAEAVEVGMADFIAPDLAEVLAKAGYRGASVIELGQPPVVTVARFLTHPVVAPLLLALGFVGLIIEMFTPGWGIAGLVGLGSLALFFGGHLVAGFAGVEVVAIFLVGMVLLAIEIFMPGFGVFGVAGILAMMISVFLASGGGMAAVRSLSVALILTVVSTVLLARYMARRGVLLRFMLAEALTGGQGYVATREREELLGKRGRSVTPLRPAGAALIEGERVDVVTEGGYIPPDTEVEVVKVEGARIVVREVS